MQWKENSKPMEQPPAGSHLARCYGLIDLGTQKHTFQDGVQLSRDVRILFELPCELMEGKYDEKSKGRPFMVSRAVKQSLHAKATMRKLLEGWRGKRFDAESIAAFDPKSIIGKACRITLIENKDFMNIDSISPCSKNDKVPKQINKSIYFSLDPVEFDEAVFKSLGEGTRKKIEASPEYIKIKNGDTSPEESGESESDEPPQSDDEPF